MYNKLLYFNIFIGTLALLIFSACSSKKGFHANNINYAYNTKNLALRPHFYVYHNLDSTAQVHYRVDSQNMLYVRTNESKSYKAKFIIAYFLVKDYENTIVLDSGKFTLEDIRPIPSQHALTGNFNINIPKSEDPHFLLHIVITDEQRQISFDNFVQISKVNIQSAQNFLLTDPDSSILFKNHIAIGAPFFLRHNNSETQSYIVSYYNREFPLAVPPYSSINQKPFELDPDSIFTVSAKSALQLNKKGFYHFRIDTSSWEGFTIYSFYKDFPYISKVEDLAQPLRYLSTKKEFEEILNAQNDPKALKKSIDNFWLERASTAKVSKTLISSFYGRVQEANMFFSSYLEGWKTDRGIVYIIYGAPDKVYRSSAGEAWVYGNENSSLSYYFNFIHVNNPFSDNDYSLERMPSYRYGWGLAIDAWRNGHIYNSKDIQREQDQSDQYRYRQRPTYWY